jgi:hypothetical protein
MVAKTRTNQRPYPRFAMQRFYGADDRFRILPPKLPLGEDCFPSISGVPIAGFFEFFEKLMLKRFCCHNPLQWILAEIESHGKGSK